MRLTSVRAALSFSLAAALALPVAAQAQETQLFTWAGRVDRQVRITMQGGNARVDATRGEEYTGRFRINNPLPQVDGTVRVIVSNGRGDVSVIQQPNAANGYTTIVRLADRSSGADRYNVTAYFTPNNTAGGWRGRNDNNGQYNNGQNNGRFENGRRVGQMGPTLHWTGLVDADAEVRWEGNRVRQRALNGNALRGVRSAVGGERGNGRMRQGGQVTVNVTEGRGSVNIVQQPSAQNGWTTVLRINDPQGGYGRYTFDVMYQ